MYWTMWHKYYSWAKIAMSSTRFREPSAETKQIIAGNCNANGIKTMKHTLIHSRWEEGTPNLSAKNIFQGAFCWHWMNQIEY